MPLKRKKPGVSGIGSCRLAQRLQPFRVACRQRKFLSLGSALAWQSQSAKQQHQTPGLQPQVEGESGSRREPTSSSGLVRPGKTYEFEL